MGEVLILSYGTGQSERCICWSVTPRETPAPAAGQQPGVGLTPAMETPPAALRGSLAGIGPPGHRGDQSFLPKQK